MSRDRLTSVDDEVVAERLRLSTRRGRPLGGDRFLAKVEALMGRHVRPLQGGRPRKAKDEGNK